MKGAIITNGYFFNAATINQTERLCEEFSKLLVEVSVYKANRILTTIGGNGGVKLVLDDGKITDFPKFDFIIYLNKDRYLAEALERAGYKLFNSCEAIVNCDDKMLTYLALGKEVNVPKTISSPIMYSPNDDEVFLKTVEAELGYPIIVKNVYGSMGRGIFKVENYFELKRAFDELKMLPHVYQQSVGKVGEDIRVMVIGGKAVSAMKRINKNDFRSNVELGGIGEKTILNKNQKTLAETAVKMLKLDYAGVDILSDGVTNYVCEVNSNAFFKGTEAVTGVNIARIYAEYIISMIK